MNELLFLLRIAAGLAVLTLLFVLVRRRVGGLPLPGRGARPRLCPHLGLASDPFKHYPGANEEHRCYASLGRERVDLAHQRRFCLASSYGRCPFLTVKDGSNGPLERIWAWGRVVSPIPQAWAGIPRRPEGSPWAPSTAALMRELARQAVPLTIMAWATLVALLAGARERFSGARTSSPQPAMRLRMATASRSAMESMAGGVVAPAAPGMPVAAPATPIGPAMPIVPGMPVAQPAVPPIGQPMPSVVPGAPMPPVPPLHVALAAPGIAEPLQASMWEPVEHAAAAPMAEPRPAPVAAGLAEPPPAPVAAGMAMTDDGDLVDRGVLALERGDEAAAYRLFKQATDADPRELRAWFWRAKTAESLDEVISCLQRALALEPGSTQIKANLDWAIQRREQAKNPTLVVKPMSARRPQTSAPRSLRPLGLAERLLSFVIEVTRATTALAAFLVAGAWMLSALPPELRAVFEATSGLQSLPVPDSTGLFGPFPLPMLDGYNAASALPYGLGFLALFVGMGLLNAETWTRLWAPVLGLGSAWLWVHATGSAADSTLLAACGMVAIGGILAFDHLPRRLPVFPQERSYA